jgi:hypothetical protein
MIRSLARSLGFKSSVNEETSVRADLETTERIVQYRRSWYGVELLKEPLSTFLYELPHITSCNILPPRHILNIVLLKGENGGSMSPKFTWDPFELSEQEYQEILPQLLDPDWSVLAPKIWRLRLPIKLDTEFDYITDRLDWMMEVSIKHQVQSKEEQEKELREGTELRERCAQYL